MKKTITRLLLLAMIGATTISNSFAGCPVTALQANGSTSGNARAPIGNFRFIRGVYLITAAEMAASGITNGQVLSQIGWIYSTPHNISVAGTLKVYFQNTADVTTTKSTTWATAISTMSLASSAADVIPAGNYFTHTLSGAPAFTYTGGALYVAYEWNNPANTLSVGAVVSCTNQPAVAMLNSQQSNTALPVTLAAASAFRPDTRLATTSGSGNCACLPVSTNGGAAGDAITSFNFATLTYSTTIAMVSPAYFSDGNPIITVGQGATYPVAITNQYSGDANNIWIDYNDNGIFDDLNEAVFQAGPGTSISSTLTISPTATLGLHKLRLRNYDTGSNALGTVTPCSGVTYGETKDFYINVLPSYSDVSVTNIYTLGKVAIEYGSPLTIKARVVNGSSSTITSYNVHLAVTGSNSFTNDQVVTLSPGTNTIVSFAPYTPTALSAGDVVTVSVASDDDNSNNSQSWTLAVTPNLYSYKNPAQTNAGGVGFTGATGDFVAKFNSHIGTNFPYNVYSPQINQIQVDFSTTNGQTYNLGIWDATGPGGTPGTNLWTSGNLVQAAGTQFVAVPNISVSGDYYVGVRQIGTTNIAFAYQSEAPIRAGNFYYTSPTGSTSWVDFSTTNSNFRFSIVAQVRIVQAPNCPSNFIPANASLVCPLNPVTLSWASGGGATADNYNVYFSTNQADVIAQAPAALVSAAQVGTTYSPVGLLTPGTTYYWKIIANSISEGLSSAGCSVQSFTVGTTLFDCYCIPEHPIGCGNGDITNVTFNAINNTSTCSAPGYTVYPAGVGTTTTVNNGLSYNLSVTTNSNCITSVWIDWNQNGSFETTEWSQVATASVAGVPDVISIPVPIGALAGQTAMRIRSRFAGNPNGDVDACTSFGSGESEDYTITVAQCSGTPDPGNTIAAAAAVCPGGLANLSLENTQVPLGINYQWQSAPASSGSWSNVGGNASTLSIPQNATTWYRCVVTCTSSGLTATSTAVSVTLNAVPQPHIVENDSIVCSNSTGYFIHVKDIGAFSGGYPTGTLFEWVNYTAPTPGLDSLFVNLTDNYTCLVYLPGNIGGCSGTSNTIFVDLGSSQSPLPLMSQNMVKCNGGSSGEVIATLISGNVASYHYQWFNSSNTIVRNVFNNQDADTLKNVAAGWYTVIVHNGLGSTQISCVAIDSIEVTQPTVLAASGTVTNVICKGANNGSIQMSPTGGTSPYTYLWNSGSTNANRNNLKPGVYTVVVTDANGCTATNSFTVTQPAAALLVNLNKTNLRCGNQLSGSVTANPVGGVGGYTYLWNTGSVSNTIVNLPVGTYTVTVTDGYGCSKSASTSLTQNPPLIVIVTNGFGSATASVAGGVAPYTYQWNTVPNQTNATATGLLNCVTYKVKVTDSKNCTKLVLTTIPCPKTTEPISTEPSVDVFPNPSTGLISIQAYNFSSQNIAVKLYDVIGNVVYSNESLFINNNVNLDFSTLSKGVYSMNILIGDKQQQIKVVLQ